MTAKYISDFTNSRREGAQEQTILRHRILVVEDKYDLRQITAEVLMDAGYQVDIAEDGASAWTALQSYPYDLLITDQFLPKVSGIELLRSIHFARLTLPIIMATGFLPIREFALHPYLRTVNLLFKPYSFEKLLNMVSLLLPMTTGAIHDMSLPLLPPETPRLSRPIQSASVFAKPHRQ
jgi:DNA-binding NtrC family response regulator